MKEDWVVGVQDMGAAGLSSSSFEMAERAGLGMELDLDAVPQREEGMNAYELMLSESQERMLFVVEKGRESEALDIFRKWDLDVAVIGRVTDDGIFRAKEKGVEVVNLPIETVVTGALKCDRPTQKPAYLSEMGTLDLSSREVPGDCGDALKQLLASPTLASKQFVYEQYDHMVRLNTLVCRDRMRRCCASLRPTRRWPCRWIATRVTGISTLIQGHRLPWRRPAETWCVPVRNRLA